MTSHRSRAASKTVVGELKKAADEKTGQSAGLARSSGPEPAMKYHCHNAIRGGHEAGWREEGASHHETAGIAHFV